jgi:plasmid stabilization system protein ParE
MNALEGLKTMPYMCPAYEQLPLFRKMVVANYLVFYTIDDENKLIEIHRILPGSWDVEKHLQVLFENVHCFTSAVIRVCLRTKTLALNH